MKLFNRKAAKVAPVTVAELITNEQRTALWDAAEHLRYEAKRIEKEIDEAPAGSYGYELIYEYDAVARLYSEAARLEEMAGGKKRI